MKTSLIPFLLLGSCEPEEEISIPPKDASSGQEPYKIDCDHPKNIEERIACTDSSARQLTIMTFNILVGGGIDSTTYDHIHDHWAFLRKNRLEKIKELIRLVDSIS